jgi:hypothetical protein
MTDGWMLPKEIFSWIDENITRGSRILEFGSGKGSIELSQKFELISIEHDEEWLNLSTGKYIHARIIENETSNSFSEQGWYDFEKMSELPPNVDLILIDGPPGNIGRSGILKILENLPEFIWMIIDDTDRKSEDILSQKIIEYFSPKEIIEIESNSQRHNGEFRKTTIIRIR